MSAVKMTLRRLPPPKSGALPLKFAAGYPKKKLPAIRSGALPIAR